MDIYTAQQISNALFETDPMRTCCKENDCFDEYDRVADEVITLLAQGQGLKQALILILAKNFYAKHDLEIDCLNPVLERLQGSQAVEG